MEFTHILQDIDTKLQDFLLLLSNQQRNIIGVIVRLSWENLGD